MSLLPGDMLCKSFISSYMYNTIATRMIKKTVLKLVSEILI